ncbi:MAG: LamG-like jellyroll fold domain-containing protein, partial [Verrucomicrobiota bacterium]
MKHHQHLLGSMALLLTISVAEAEVEALQSAREKYEQQSAEILQKHEVQLEKLGKDHLDGIDKLTTAFRTTGELDALIEVRTARKNFLKQGRIDTPASNPNLARLEEKYTANRNRLEQEKNKVVTRLQDSYRAHLKQLMKKLTKAGRLDQALAVRDEIDAIGTPADPSSGKDVLSQPLKQALALHYPFNDDQGEAILDASGNDRHAKASGGRWLKDGQRGGVFELKEHAQSFQTTGYTGVTGNAPRTVALWFRNIDTQRKGWSTSLLEWGRSRPNQKFKLAYGPGPNQFRIDVGQHVQFTTVGEELMNKSWHHIAATFPEGGTIEDVRIYMNGKRVEARPASFNKFKVAPLDTYGGEPVEINS